MEKELLWTKMTQVPDWGALWHHVWLVDVSLARVDRSALTWAESLLSESELERSRRFRFERDQVRHRMTHAVLRSVLSGYLGVNDSEVEYELGAKGKPYLARRFAEEPRRVEFNLSHSGEWALIAISRYGEVGVDIEAHREGVAGLDIAERYFSRREVESYLRIPEAERGRAFFEGWSRKEAFIKASGEGLFRDLGSFSVELEPGKPARLLEVEGSQESGESWDMAELPVPAGYSGTLVVKSGAPGGVRALGLFLWQRGQA